MKTPNAPRLAAMITPFIFSSLLRADVTITGSGTVTVGGSSEITFNAGTLRIGNGAQLIVQPAALLTGGEVEVASTGKLYNCGTINAGVSNAGEIVADCGVNSFFLGNVTNSGIFRVSHGSSLIAPGSFQNNPGALLDLITAAQTGPPPFLTGTGTLVVADDVRIESINAGASNAEIAVQGVPPHTYQLVGSNDLSAAVWPSIGPMKVATGGQLIWDHAGVVLNFDRYFYRVMVGDP